MQQIEKTQNSSFQTKPQTINLHPSILKLQQFLKEKQMFIQNDLHYILKQKIGHNTYPIKMLKQTIRLPDGKTKPKGEWNYIYQTLSRRLIKFTQNQKQLKVFLISDLIKWAIPNLGFCYMTIMNYIRKWKTQANLQANKQLCKLIMQERSQKSLPKIQLQNQEVSQLNMLRIPLVLIKQLFNLFIQVIEYYQDQQFKYKEEIKNQDLQNPEEISRILNLVILEQDYIENGVKQAFKCFNEVETIQTLDPQVYKNRLILSGYIAVNNKNKYLIKFGVRTKFLQILGKRVAKAQKRLKDRRGAIQQLIDGQLKYVGVINDYIQYIKKPIQNLKILTQDQDKTLFSSIQEICQFHALLYEDLQKRFQKYEKYQTYGDIVKKYIPYFKLYVDYIYIAETAQNFMIKLEKQNEKVAQIHHKFFIQKKKYASQQLLQPTFKIARYDMLFDQIMKKTNPTHPDYSKLQDARLLFKKNLTEVNDTVDKIVRRNKLNQLEQEYGTKEQPVFKLHRQFLDQFHIFIIKEERLDPVIVFCFTDLIMICDQVTRKKIKWIQVDQKFYVRREEDNKTYKNMIKIHSNGFTTLSTGDQQKNFKKAEEFYQVLKKITKQSQTGQLVYVQVLGTEQIGSTSFAKHTQYIIEVKYISLKKLLHLRFSQVEHVVKNMQHEYKNNLGITQEETLKKTWFNNHKSKTIEDRKRTIEQILQKLMNHQEVRKEPRFLLNYLGLPPNFFQLARRSSLKRQSRQSSNSLMESLVGKFDFNKMQLMQKKHHSSLSKKQQKQAFTILCATQIKLGRDIYHQVDEDIQMQRQLAEKKQIYIRTMKSDQKIMIKVTQFDTIQDVCNKVSKLIGLRSNRDFRLFHQIGKKQLRVLEHQQKILKMFTFPRNSTQTINGILQNVTSSLKQIISPQTHPTLIFKKYYYLPFSIEQHQAKKDLTRLRLLVYQIFWQVKDMKYQLSFDQYLLFAAMMIYIQLDGEIEKKVIEPNIIHTIIPQTIFKLKNYTQQQWLQRIHPHLLKLREEIKKVITYNKEQLIHNKIKTDTISKTALYFGHRHLCSQIVLNKIKTNPIFGSNLFYVQPYKTTYDMLAKQNKMAYNMWLAVKVQSLNLLTPSSKETVMQLKYKDIQKINVYSEAIVLKTDDYTNLQYRFNTYQSFQISQLVKYNKALNEILKQLGDNQVLDSKVKKYKEQLMNYRTTYDLQSGSKIKLEP